MNLLGGGVNVGRMKTAEQLVAEARARIEEWDVARLRSTPEAVIVDVRDVRERAKGFIPGSVHAPRGMLEFWWDPASPYHRKVFAGSGPYVLHCAMGWRSALAAAALKDMGFEVAHLAGGFDAWVEAGGDVEMSVPREAVGRAGGANPPRRGRRGADFCREGSEPDGFRCG